MTGRLTEQKTMRAVVQDRYGSTDVVQTRMIPIPQPMEDQVLIEARAAGVDPGVWHLMMGEPYLVRVMGYGLRRPKHHVLGSEVAGIVQAVGANVTDLMPGDEVFGTTSGSFADFALAKESRIALKPTNLSFEEAAAVPISAVTALQGLRDVGQIKAGQKVLVIGAGGGVGSFAVQLGKFFGAEVTGLCSTEKVDLVRKLGADLVVDYQREEIGPSRYDLILDTAGSRPLGQLRKLLTPRGSLVIVGGEGGGKILGAVSRVVRAVLLSPFISQNLRFFVATEGRKDLMVLKELIEAGHVKPVIGRTYQLDQVREAINYVQEGHALGKTLITFE